MESSWNYAKLSKDAKAGGGPEKYLEKLELLSKNAGKKEMVPYIYLAVVGSSIFTLVAVKLTNHIKTKKRNEEEIKKTKEELISQMKCNEKKIQYNEEDNN